MPKSSSASRTPSRRSSVSMSIAVVGILHRARLGDLEDQAVRAGSRSRPALSRRPAVRLRVAQLALREVDADHELVVEAVARPPAAELLAGQPQNGATDRRHDARLLGERDEVVRKDEATRRDGASARAPRARRPAPSRARRSAGSTPRSRPARPSLRASSRAPAGAATRRASPGRTRRSRPCRSSSPSTSRRPRSAGCRRRRCRRGRARCRSRRAPSSPCPRA